MSRKLHRTLLATGLALSASLASSTAAGPCPQDRECIGLVLAGGGARGAAHVGILEVMEELKVPVDFIVGTSMGAIVGGMYASGMSPDEMRRHLTEIDWEEAFDDNPPRRNIPFRQKEDDDLSLFKLEFGFGKDGAHSPRGLVAGQKLSFILRSLLIHQSNLTHFDDLPVPFRAIAVDLASGEPVPMDHGDLVTAIRASMAYPVMFTPVEVDGQLLVDGGVLRNLPVDIAIEMGADRLIAVDVGTPLSEMQDISSALKLAGRVLSVLTAEGRVEQRELIREQDLLIVPDLTGLTAFDSFGKVDEAIKKGQESGQAHRAQLRRFSVDDETYAAFFERQRGGRDKGPIVIDRVEVEGNHRVSSKRITGRIHIQPGQAFDSDALRDDLARVYRIGEFETVGFEIDEALDETVLKIRPTEKSWGPWFYRLGMSLAADFDGQGDFTANVLLRRPNLNALGAEWKTFVTIGSVDSLFSELYQPLDFAGRFFVAPSIYHGTFGEKRLTVVGTQTDLFKVNRSELGIDLGFRVRNTGEIRTGPRRGFTESESRSGFQDATESETGGWLTRFSVDRLENANFPRGGTAFNFELFNSIEELGADTNYDRLWIDIAQVWPLGRWRQLISLSYGTALGTDIPGDDDFGLGGFLQLSGIDVGSLRGERAALVRLIPYFKVAELPTLFGGDMYVGGSLEAGQVWPEVVPFIESESSDVRLAGSVFAGVDTLFGPLYLGYGLADGGHSSVYLFLGRVFGASPFGDNRRGR